MKQQRSKYYYYHRIKGKGKGKGKYSEVEAHPLLMLTTLKYCQKHGRQKKDRNRKTPATHRKRPKHLIHLKKTNINNPS